MKLSDKLKARRVELSTAMTAMVDTLATESRDFNTEERTKFDGLKSEKDALAQRIADAEAAEDGERREKGRDVGEHRQLGEGEVRALRPEQRMADGIRREGPPLSLGRMVRAMITGNWQDADAERRAMGENTGSIGGLFVPASLSANVIDIARNKSVVVPAGALTIPMDSSEMTVVKVLTDPTPYWRRESQPISESGQTFAPIKLRAMTLGCITRVSLELLEDAPRFSTQVEDAMGAAIALEIDRVGLFGAGTSEPRGLTNTDGINTVSMGPNGATPDDFDEFLDAIATIENSNGVAGAAIYSPRTKRTLAGLKTGISGDKTPLTPPSDFTALKRLVSNQIPNNLTQGSSAVTSTAFVGDFSQMGIAIRTGLTLEATRTGGTGTFAQMEALIRAYIRADVAVFRPSHFARIVGIKA